LLDKKNQSPAPTPSTTPAPAKEVESNCVTCGATVNYNQGNTGFRPQMVANQIRPPGFPPHQNNQNNFNRGNNFNQNRGGNFNQSNFNPPSFNQGQLNRPLNTAPVQPLVIQSESQALVSGPVVAPVSAPMTNLKPSIPYPSRRDNEKRHDQANEQIKKFYEIFKEMSFEISFTDALILMPKFAATLKALIENKEKLSEMARTTMNEHYLGAIINLMPLLVWEGLLLPELTPTCMTFELADRSIYKPIGIAKDISFKVGVFHFPADFVGELTLRIGNEAITYNLDQTVRYSANYNQMMTNKIDVVEEYSQEVLCFSNVTDCGISTPQNEPVVSVTSPTLTPFGDSDFLLFEEADAFLGLEDDPDSPKINPFYYDPEGDILLLEAILNSEPSPPLPNQEQNMSSFK
nr:hypothetical protein [Tanacetum cinerariifolium]